MSIYSTPSSLKIMFLLSCAAVNLNTFTKNSICSELVMIRALPDLQTEWPALP